MIDFSKVHNCVIEITHEDVIDKERFGDWPWPVKEMKRFLVFEDGTRIDCDDLQIGARILIQNNDGIGYLEKIPAIRFPKCYTMKLTIIPGRESFDYAKQDRDKLKHKIKKLKRRLKRLK